MLVGGSKSQIPAETLPSFAASRAWGFADGDTASLQRILMSTVDAIRCQSVTWTDKSGNLWLFGGAINSSYAGTIDAVQYM